jgi:hypothetical protein
VPVLPNSCLSLTDGVQPLINALQNLAILDYVRARWPINVNALTHWQADHAILSYC